MGAWEMGRFLLVSYLEPRVLAYIATAKVIRTFLIVETLDFLSLEPSALCLLPSAFCYTSSSWLHLCSCERQRLFVYLSELR
jgi:hypothetical protein